MVTSPRYHVLFIAPYPELADVVAEVTPDFPELSVTIHEGDLSKGLAAALSSMDVSFDVVVSRGGTAQLLEDEFALPVVEVGLSASDLFRCLVQYNPSAKRCALVGFSNVLEPLRDVAGFSDFDLDLFEVSFEDELPLVLKTVQEGSYSLVLCDTFSLPQVRELGLNAQLLASGPDSVSKALTEAQLFCERSSDLLAKNRMLWNLVRSQDARFVVFADDGKITYTNVKEGHDVLISFMREHLGERVDERLVFQHGRLLFHIHKMPVESGGENFLAFSVMHSQAPTNAAHVGITRRNRSDIEDEYERSIFHITQGSQELAQVLAPARGATRPILLASEPSCGKEQAAQLLYLTGSWKTRPFVRVDCSLLTDKSWDYLMNSPASPLYIQEATIFLNSFQDLPDARARLLLDAMRRSGLPQRDRLIVSVNAPNALSAEMMELLTENLRYIMVELPPLRARRDLAQAISLCLDSLCAEAGAPRPVVTEEALQLLLEHEWPGNYAEFRTVLEYCLEHVQGGAIDASCAGQALQSSAPYSFSTEKKAAGEGSISLMRPLHDIERDIVKATIERCHGNQTEAARILQVSRTTIWRLLKDS
ncbi:MAG: PrpR N-terminal domain-containing protein [Atopobiaceae bacterium]